MAYCCNVCGNKEFAFENGLYFCKECGARFSQEELDLQKQENEKKAVLKISDIVAIENGEYCYQINASADKNQLNIAVYRRPNGSYFILNKHTKDFYEGYPTFTLEKVGFLSYAYHPSEAIYTGASVGGIHMGGVHYTKEYYSTHVGSTDNSKIIVHFGNNLAEVETFSLNRALAERILLVQGLGRMVTDSGKTIVIQNKSMVNSAINVALQSNGNYYDKMQMMSAGMTTAYPKGTECATFLNNLRSGCEGNLPNKAELFDKACELSQREDSDSLKKASEMFGILGDYKNSAIKKKGAQANMERAIRLEEESRKKDKELHRIESKKRTKKVGVVIVIIIAAIVLLWITFSVILPQSTYKAAEKAYAAGDYELAIQKCLQYERSPGHNSVTEIKKGAMLARAKDLLDEEHSQEAMETLQEYIDMFPYPEPEEAREYLRLAKTQYCMEQYAAGNYEYVLEHIGWKDETEAQYHDAAALALGEQAEKSGDMETAINYYRRLLDKDESTSLIQAKEWDYIHAHETKYDDLSLSFLAELYKQGDSVAAGALYDYIIEHLKWYVVNARTNEDITNGTLIGFGSRYAFHIEISDFPVAWEDIIEVENHEPQWRFDKHFMPLKSGWKTSTYSERVFEETPKYNYGTYDFRLCIAGKYLNEQISFRYIKK